MAEDEGDVLGGTQIGEPVPAEDALDADDEVVYPEGIPPLRDQLEEVPDDCDALDVPYILEGGKVRNWRHRWVRFGRGWSWDGRIHEVQVQKKVVLSRVARAHGGYEIRHHPVGVWPKVGRDLVTIRIIEGEDGPTFRTLVYRATYALASGAVAEAVTLAEQASEVATVYEDTYRAAALAGGRGARAR